MESPSVGYAMNYEEVAVTLENFIDGGGSPWDWDVYTLVFLSKTHICGISKSEWRTSVTSSHLCRKDIIADQRGLKLFVVTSGNSEPRLRMHSRVVHRHPPSKRGLRKRRSLPSIQLAGFW